MVEWFDRREENNLSAPLLPRGGGDDPVAAAAAHAVAQSTALRQSRATAKRRRRRRPRSNNVSRQESDVSRQESGGAISATSDESTHVADNLSEDDHSDSGSERTDYGEDAPSVSDMPIEKMTPGAMARSAAVVLAVGGGIVAYSTALIFASTVAAASATAMTVLGVAGGVCVLTTPLVLRSEWRLAKLPTLRGRANALRHQAERFRTEMEVLMSEEEELREEAKYFEKTHERLQEVVKGKNAGNVDDLLGLVHENQTVLLQMKENLRQMVLQEVVKLVLKCDVDRDNALNKREATVFQTRLTASLEIYGISFDSDKFYRAVGLSPSLYGVVAIVKRLLPDEYGRCQSSFYDDCVSDEDEDSDCGDPRRPEEDDDVYDMFYVPVEDEFHRGNTDSIRLAKDYLERTGERPTLMSLSALTSRSVRGFRRRSDGGE